MDEFVLKLFEQGGLAMALAASLWTNRFLYLEKQRTEERLYRHLDKTNQILKRLGGIEFDEDVDETE